MNREFTRCTTFLHRLSPIRFPFTSGEHSEEVITDVLPDAPIVAIAVSIVVAITVGALIDLMIRRRTRRQASFPPAPLPE